MDRTVFALPVTVEQIATTIKQMSQTERQRLFELVPELRTEPPARQRAIAEAQASVTEIDVELVELLGKQSLSPDEPFLGELTLGQFLDLPDDKRAQLWDAWSGDQAWFDGVEEKDVRSDALPA